MKNKLSSGHERSRRKFLKTSGGIAFVIGATGIYPQLISCKNESTVKKQLEKYALTAWVQMSEDGQIIIYNPAAEMGQGSMTSLPVIFAEEMDADWSNVKVEFSPQESEVYGSDGWGPNRRIMLSAGSRVTKGYFSLLRNAGAQARYILRYSAATKWGVPLDEVTTSTGFVVHTDNDLKMKYGDLVPYLIMPETIPSFKDEELKNPKDFKYIGKTIPRTDIPSKVNGSAQFAIDVRLPNMLYGVFERGRVHGAIPTLTNRDIILTMPGVVKIVEIDYAIGVIAKNIESALSAKKELQIEWGEAASSGFSSSGTYKTYKEIAEGRNTGKSVTDTGNFERALKRAAKSYKADFKNDYVYHAQMEPLNAVVRVAEDGLSAEAWVGSQQGFDSKLGLPKTLGIDPKNIKINLQYLGGGFGRRSMTDFVTECAHLAKEVPGQPVKLIWTREDDLTYGAFRPMSLQRLEATTDVNGSITGFSHVIVGDGDNLIASGIKNEHYDIPNQYADLRIVPHGIRLKHWRAVGHGPNKFAIECMIDEIAYDQNADTMDIRRKLMSKSPRALATLEKAASMSGWDQPGEEGRAKGIAFAERSGTLSTGICEISVDRSTGKIKVHHFWSASDAGIIIQPDNVKAQMEGGIIMGISSVLKEQITIEEGRVQQSNFNDYHLLRMEDIPESIETALIASSAPPQGVGESGTPLVAGAVANAFLALTGKRLRHLPFTPERVLEALNT